MYENNFKKINSKKKSYAFNRRKTENPNTKFPKGSKAHEENRLYVYDFTDRRKFHNAIDYLIDNDITPAEIKW